MRCIQPPLPPSPPLEEWTVAFDQAPLLEAQPTIGARHHLLRSGGDVMAPSMPHVIRAVEEYDQRGDAAFLRKYGFRPSTRYDLIVGKKRYPPKAIWGAAHKFADGQQLYWNDFFGGPALNQKFEELGFVVRQKLSPEGYQNPDIEIPIPRDSDEMSLRAVRLRRGQKKFRNTLIKIYGGKCAITGAVTPEILDAAHVRPHSLEGDYSPANGILLRTDIHTLFDEHLLRIDPGTRRVVVESRVEESEYRKLDGKSIFQPPNKTHQISDENLRERWASD